MFFVVSFSHLHASVSGILGRFNSFFSDEFVLHNLTFFFHVCCTPHSYYLCYSIIVMMYVSSLHSFVLFIATRLRTGRFGVRVLVAIGDFSPKRPILFWGPPRLLLCGYRAYALGVKRPGHQVNQWPPSTAEVKNKCSFTSSPYTFLHGMYKKNV